MAIKRSRIEALTVDDEVKLSRVTHFSILDMNEAYHQIKLDESSHKMTMFYSIFGRLRYKRLNYGPISPQDIFFDKAIDDTIHGLSGVLHISDDFVVYGCDNGEHD